ncbi:MAG: metallophosphoesterase family protein [Prosthecobacter sp.]|nr:metallophosphoesterase family protein [Prosthecobacter sp.]
MRTLAIGDIHGCSTALRTLLDAVQPGADDIVVTMGDYVDRGPDSRGVLDMLLTLESRTQLKPLTGNHEILFTDAAAGRLPKENWLAVGGRETLFSYTGGHSWEFDAVPKEHLDFLNNRCLRYFEMERHFFVHANANAVLPLAEQPDDWLFWTRFENSYPHVSGKMMICGHTAQKEGLPVIRPQALCIDTWVYGEGWLTCMDVGAGTFIQTNQAGKVRQFTFAHLQEQALGAATRQPGSAQE